VWLGEFTGVWYLHGCGCSPILLDGNLMVAKVWDELVCEFDISFSGGFRVKMIITGATPTN